jgi:hypothetical protein
VKNKPPYAIESALKSAVAGAERDIARQPA